MFPRRFSVETAAAEVTEGLDDDFDFESAAVANSPVSQQTFSEEPMYTFPQCQSTPTSSGASISTSSIASRPDSELLLLMQQVVSGQEKLTSQVSDLQQRLGSVEASLSTLQSDHSGKEDTTNRVDPELTVSHNLLLYTHCYRSP